MHTPVNQTRGPYTFIKQSDKPIKRHKGNEAAAGSISERAQVKSINRLISRPRTTVSSESRWAAFPEARVVIYIYIHIHTSEGGPQQPPARGAALYRPESASAATRIVHVNGLLARDSRAAAAAAVGGEFGGALARSHRHVSW